MSVAVTMNDPSNAGVKAATGNSSLTGSNAADLQSSFLTLLVAQLKNQDPTNPLQNNELTTQLAHVRQKRNIPWITILLMVLICGGIAWGYFNGGRELGRELLLQWVLWTGGLAGLGALLARGHVLSILAAAISAPLKPFRPGLPPGMFSALAEVHLRKPAYPDFLALRDDAQTLAGWYRNRVCRVVLVFLLTNLGSMLGVWISGAAIVRKLMG